jgi:hypothetical protein
VVCGAGQGDVEEAAELGLFEGSLTVGDEMVEYRLHFVAFEMYADPEGRIEEDLVVVGWKPAVQVVQDNDRPL